MDEAGLKRDLVHSLKENLPGCTVIRHEDKSTAGIPDISITWRDKTVWVEVKYDRPSAHAKTTQRQLLMLRRLKGFLLTYIQEKNGDKRAVLQDFKVTGPDIVVDVDRGWGHKHIVREIAMLRFFKAETDHQRVAEFHRKFELFAPSTPGFDRDVAWTRHEHIQEEMSELTHAVQARDLPEVADALADLVYLCHGMALNLGIPWEAVFDEVHRSNMRKERVKRKDHKFGIGKPEGWRGPDIRGIIRFYGWKENNRDD